MPTTEEKLATLEEKFVALEKKYHDLEQKASTENTNKVNGVADTQLTPPTNGKPDKDAVSALLHCTIAANVDVTKKPAEEENSPTSRMRVLINRVDSNTGERKDQPPSDLSPAVSQANDKCAFTLRKILHTDALDNEGEIEIESQDLWDLLKELLAHYPYHTFRGAPVTLYSPFEALIFDWEKLEQATKQKSEDEKDKIARSDLKLLLDTIAKGSGDPKLDKYFKTRESYKQQKSVTFETLWTVFPPGTLVYGKPFQGQDQVFIVQDNWVPWPPTLIPRRYTTWTLSCWTYDWDGKKFRRMPLILKFEKFDGMKPITSLPYYPLELNDNHNAIRERLIERGGKYRDFCTAKQGSQMFDYLGDAMFAKKGFSGVQGDDDKENDVLSQSTLEPDIELLRNLQSSFSAASSRAMNAATKSSNVESRVMVDFESYFRYGPALAQVGSLMPDDDDISCDCLECRENKDLGAMYRSRFDEEANQRGVWEQEQYMLCPPRVLGYVLRDKQWAQLQVTSLKILPKADPKNSWSSRLKLADGEETKKMILDLVNGHGSTSGTDGLEVDDIVAKKGKGLVILLYGPPGVGKTSTAETVAIAAEKPLFSISVADVGTKAKNVEANLAKIFALAASWRAILLIDEADVFLESRGKGVASNTERNALVSVFLRVLEYYQGILMLTTNQIAQFDVAVQSRIHIAIKYTSLNEDQTMAIFRGFLDPLDRKGLVKDMEDIIEWLKEDVCPIGLDGRQIRNIVTSALGLARAEKKPKIEKKMIKQVQRNVSQFKDEFVIQYEKYKNEQFGMISK